MVAMSAKKHKPDKRDFTTGQFSKGVSGNPAGRPPGSRNKSTLLWEEMLDGQAPALLQKVIDLALKGDPTALRLCLERISPPRKERLIDLSLPRITEGRHASAALTSILSAAAEGRITPGEAETLARTVEIHTRIIETEDLARRLDGLERAFAEQVGQSGTISSKEPQAETSNERRATCGSEDESGTENG
jgi:hypothetical protein